MIAVATVGMFVALALATGLLLAFTPYLMRRNECFAVTVPPSAQHDPRLIALKKRYATIMVVVTAVSAIAALVAGVFLIQGSAQSDGKPAAIGIALECAALFIPIVISFALMLRNRRRVVDIKRAEGWTAQAQQAIATIVETDQPQALPLQWNLLYIPVIVGTLAFGLALYPAMPDMLPMHADFAGNVNDWAPKTLGSAIGFPRRAHERRHRRSLPAFLRRVHRIGAGRRHHHGLMHPRGHRRHCAFSGVRPGGVAHVQEDTG